MITSCYSELSLMRAHCSKMSNFLAYRPLFYRPLYYFIGPWTIISAFGINGFFFFDFVNSSSLFPPILLGFFLLLGLLAKVGINKEMLAACALIANSIKGCKKLDVWFTNLFFGS